LILTILTHLQDLNVHIFLLVLGLTVSFNIIIHMPV